MKTLLSLILCSLLPAAWAGSGFLMNQQGLLATHSAPIEFSPADIPDLSIWLAADDISGSDGDTFETWPAHSPTTISATQGTVASRATIQLGEINGHSAALSDGVNDFATLSASLSTAGSWTVITVQKRLSSGGLGGSLGNSFGPIPPFAALEYGSLSRMYIASRTDQKYSTIPSHAFHVITSQDNAGTLVMRVDGSNQSLTAAAATGTLDLSRIFARGTEYWGTYIAEIVAWPRALNSTELGQVETYFKTKYGTP